MDGDSAPVEGLVAQSRDSGAWLMLDDAHGFGVLGENGFGVAEHYQLTQQDLPVLMGTFGKAVGTAGAFVAGSQAFIDYLVNHARHYIYSTALPASQAIATLYSLTAISTGDERKTLHENIATFRSLAMAQGLQLTESVSAIQPVMCGDPHKALALSEALKQRGIWVPAIRYPTVPKGADRLRITITAQHSARDISVLVDALMLAMEAV